MSRSQVAFRGCAAMRQASVNTLASCLSPLCRRGMLSYNALLCFYLLCMCVYEGCICCGICLEFRGQFVSQFSPPTLWVPGIQFRSLGLVASACDAEPSHWPRVFCFVFF